MCVFYYCRTYYKAVRVGGGGEWRTCAMRDDEPRPVWMSLPITHLCVCFITAGVHVFLKLRYLIFVYLFLSVVTESGREWRRQGGSKGRVPGV